MRWPQVVKYLTKNGWRRFCENYTYLRCAGRTMEEAFAELEDRYAVPAAILRRVYLTPLRRDLSPARGASIPERRSDRGVPAPRSPLASGPVPHPLEEVIQHATGNPTPHLVA